MPEDITELETAILYYVKQNPNITAEDAITYFADYDDVEKRREVSEAIARLWKDKRIRWNTDNGVITVWGIV